MSQMKRSLSLLTIGLLLQSLTGCDSSNAEGGDPFIERVFEILKENDADSLKEVNVTLEWANRYAKANPKIAPKPEKFAQRSQESTAESLAAVHEQTGKDKFDWSKAKLVRVEMEGNPGDVDSPKNRVPYDRANKRRSLDVYLVIEAGDQTITVELNDCTLIDGQRRLGDGFRLRESTPDKKDSGDKKPSTDAIDISIQTPNGDTWRIVREAGKSAFYVDTGSGKKLKILENKVTIGDVLVGFDADGNPVAHHTPGRILQEINKLPALYMNKDLSVEVVVEGFQGNAVVSPNGSELCWVAMTCKSPECQSKGPNTGVPRFVNVLPGWSIDSNGVIKKPGNTTPAALPNCPHCGKNNAIARYESPKYKAMYSKLMEQLKASRTILYDKQEKQ